MPRVARLDFEGGLYHVIGRGVERRRIFRSPRDCEDFEHRLSVLLEDEDMTLFAYALMVNHFHLVVRREGRRRLGHFMGRLLTGYVASFNLRYRRAGHLFQNRYKSVLCDQDAYLLQLVRYVHLNPVRASMVDDPCSYRWSSQRDYLDDTPRSWVDTVQVLEQIGGRRAYRQFVADGHGEGERLELCGSKRVSSRSSPPAGNPSSNLWFGGQVLGDKQFARQVVRRMKNNAELREELGRGGTEANLPALAQRAARASGIAVGELSGSSRRREVCQARRKLVELAVLNAGIRPVEVARYLRISRASVAAYQRKLTI